MNIPAVRAKCLGAELTADLPAVWQGRALRFQCGIFKTESVSESSFSNVVSFTLSISRDRRENCELVTETLALASMDVNGAIPLVDWEAGTTQHLTFQLSGEQMAVTLFDPDERLWWTLIAELDSGEVVTAGAGFITFREDGAPGGGVEAAATTVSVTNGIASATVNGVEHKWVVTSTTGTIAAGTGTVSVTNGIATLALGASAVSWVVTGSPGTSSAGAFILTVASGIGSFSLGGGTYSMPVTP